jgi:histidinol-phosphate aminotransferase
MTGSFPLQPDLPAVHYYPEQRRALEALARHLDVPPEQLLLTNGSDELCQLVATLLLGQGTAAVLGDPCYSIDASVSLMAGAELRRIPLVAGGHDLRAMAQAAQGASVVWLPTPHNPTGVAVDPDALESFLALVPSNCLVVLDEAYRALADPARRPDWFGLLARHDNLLVQRTFSKDAGLAGMRIGYAIGSLLAVALAGPEFRVAGEFLSEPAYQTFLALASGGLFVGAGATLIDLVVLLYRNYQIYLNNR